MGKSAELQTRAKGIVNKFFPQVKTIVDSTRPIAFEVTKGDANSRGVKNHTACAVAQACKRNFALDGAIISLSRAYLIRGQVATRYEIPTGMAREIVSFDRGGSFEPGQYKLTRIHATHRMGKSGGGKHSGKGKQTTKRHVTQGIRTVIHA